MNIHQKYWPKLKQELASITLLSALQIWWSFNCPVIIRLGQSWSTVASIVLSITSVLFCIIIFLSPDTYMPFPNLDYLDEWPTAHGPLLKTVVRIGIIIFAAAGMLFMAYKDIYGMSRLDYAFSFVNLALAFLLIARSKNRDRIQTQMHPNDNQ